jgi:hypothetical protein
MSVHEVKLAAVGVDCGTLLGGSGATHGKTSIDVARRAPDARKSLRTLRVPPGVDFEHARTLDRADGQSCRCVSPESVLRAMWRCLGAQPSRKEAPLARATCTGNRHRRVLSDRGDPC